MTLKRIFIQNFRNISMADIHPSPQVNLIFGENGSGKTSILEAINSLALGRSFRTHKFKPLILNGENNLTVFGKVLTHEQSEVPIGIKRHSNGLALFKVNGVHISSAAVLATYLPVQIINSDTFLLLDGAPKIRREFLDWLVFHVEPNFIRLWKDSQRCLKQRNSLLRHDRIDHLQLSIWDKELSLLTEQIHIYRNTCFEHFKSVLIKLLSEFIVLEKINFSYFRGWDVNMPYSEALSANLTRDKHQGFTGLGIHKADLHIKFNGYNAADVLSRGQIKLLVCALKIAQGQVFSFLTGRKSLYLIDDLPAELDSASRDLLIHWISKMNTQLFISGVEPKDLLSSWQNHPEFEIKMFHVEQGKISEHNLNS
jgi:DNA replication and repair protein RecF